MTIRLEVKQHYGAEHIYVVGDAAKAVRALTGKRTVDEHDLNALRALGHDIEIPTAFALTAPAISRVQ